MLTGGRAGITISRQEDVMKKRSFVCSTPRELEVMSTAAHKNHSSVVLVTGVWDMLHSGHVRYLEDASRLGDVLFVGVATDRRVKTTKDPTRPIVSEDERLEIISSLSMVDSCFLFDDVLSILRALKPDVLVVSPTTKTFPELVERDELARELGARVVSIESRYEGHTTDRIASIATRFSR